MPERGACEICGKPVEEWNSAAWPVTGWELERKGKGGANYIALKKRLPDRIAHMTCIESEADKRRRGVIPGQTSFV